MSEQAIKIAEIERTKLVTKGRRLEYFTIAYNSLQGLAALVTGLMAGSVALVGFGFDSLIEVTSGAALLGHCILTRTNHGGGERRRLRSALLVSYSFCWLCRLATTQSNH
jgi:hypothetical protein